MEPHAAKVVCVVLPIPRMDRFSRSVSSFPGGQMLLRARRVLGILFLAGLMACAITTIAAAATSHRVTRHRSTARHRHGRHNPPGGCYARSAIVMDPATDEVLYNKNADSSV